MIKRLYIFLTLALLIMTQTSCIYENSLLCESADADSVVISFDLTVPASSALTRSLAEDHNITPGTEDENYINIEDEDFRILLFDKDGNLIEDKLSDFECNRTGNADRSVSYKLSATLTLSSDEDRENLSKFKVMVLANWESFEHTNTRSSFEYPSFEGYSVDRGDRNIYKDKENLNYILKDSGSDYTWTPSVDANRCIPMFGITDALDLQHVLDMSKYGDGPCFSVPMLRAMAKVKIIDESKERISGVSMSNANRTGRFIPEIDESNSINTNWSDPDTQIETPSIPTERGNIDKIVFMKGEDTPEGYPAWVAYIPEMDFAGLDNSDRPKFTIYDGGAPMDPVPFNNYNEDGEVVADAEDFLKAVLRNHIYTYRVTISDKSTVAIKLKVLPWDLEYEDIPSYFDTPQLAEDGWLKWKTVYTENDDVDEDKFGQPNEFIDDPDKLILTMKPTTEEYAEAVFTLVAPKNCRWYVQLQSLGGNADAFYFVDADGEALLNEDGSQGYPEGIIDRDGNGSKCTIRIKNRSVKVTNYPNEAKLMVFIEYPDKSIREVKIVEGKMVYGDGDTVGKWVDNYTIYQAPTDIYD